MKKVVLVLGVITLMVLAGLVAGCGGSGDDSADDQATRPGLVEITENEVAGHYVEGSELSDATGLSVSLNEDGTFSGDAWGPPTTGTYEVTSLGGYSVIFNFEDGRTQRWSIMIGNDEVHGLVSEDDDQYTRQR